MIRIFLGCFIFSFSAFSIVAPILLDENRTITATFSNKHLNRIEIVGDEVCDTFSSDAAIDFIKDEKNGQVFIRLKGVTRQDVSFITVTTMHKKLSQDFLIRFKDINGKAIKLISEDKNMFLKRANNLLSAMSKNISFSGFAIKKTKEKFLITADAEYTIVKKYLGKKMIGEVVEILNKSNKIMLINSEKIWNKYMIASYVAFSCLKPKTKGYFFVVRKRHE